MKTFDEIKVRNIKNEEQIYNFLKRNCNGLKGEYYIVLEDEYCENPSIEYYRNDPTYGFKSYSIRILIDYFGVYWCCWRSDRGDKYCDLKKMTKQIFELIKRDYI